MTRLPSSEFKLSKKKAVNEIKKCQDQGLFYVVNNQETRSQPQLRPGGKKAASWNAHLSREMPGMSSRDESNVREKKD